MLCVPVKIKAGTIGVLQAINKIGGVFTEEDRELFLLFANEVAIALDNARLYREIRDTFYATSGAPRGGHRKTRPLYRRPHEESFGIQSHHRPRDGLTED